MLCSIVYQNDVKVSKVERAANLEWLRRSKRTSVPGTLAPLKDRFQDIKLGRLRLLSSQRGEGHAEGHAQTHRGRLLKTAAVAATAAQDCALLRMVVCAFLLYCSCGGNGRSTSATGAAASTTAITAATLCSTPTTLLTSV